jgi:nicotinamidase-related amidase
MKNTRIQPEHTAFLVIDIQDRLAPAIHKTLLQDMLRNIPILLTAARGLELPVILTEQYPKGLGSTIEEIATSFEALPPSQKLGPYEKVVFSAFSTKENETCQALKNRGIQNVVVTGMEAHICVYQTVCDLLAMDFNVFVVNDAIGSRAVKNYYAALSLMQQAGAIMVTTEMLVFDLLKKAGTPLFKEISKMIR